VMDVVYKNGQLFSSYVKNVKDDVTEVVTIIWDGAKYVIKKGEETFILSKGYLFVQDQKRGHFGQYR